MPEFLYMCEKSHFQSVVHSMSEDPEIDCLRCGFRMWRKPQSFIVNWGGSRPSDGGPAPDVQRLIDTAPERRDDFEKRRVDK